MPAVSARVPAPPLSTQGTARSHQAEAAAQEDGQGSQEAGPGEEEGRAPSCAPALDQARHPCLGHHKREAEGSSVTVLSLDTGKNLGFPAGTWTPGCGEREPSSDPSDGHLWGKLAVPNEGLCAQAALRNQVVPPRGSSQT